MSAINRDMKAFGQEMFASLRDSCETFEEASEKIVQYLFEAFHTDDKPEFSLIRIYRTATGDELPADLSPNASLPGRDYLALMGTIGVEDAWCNRRLSKSRKTILIGESMSPMFKGVFHDLGFSWVETEHEAEITGKRVRKSHSLGICANGPQHGERQ